LFKPDIEFTGAAPAEEAAIFPTGENILFPNFKHARIVSCCALNYERGLVVASVADDLPPENSTSQNWSSLVI
jgi:hypothetical protein